MAKVPYVPKNCRHTLELELGGLCDRCQKAFEKYQEENGVVMTEEKTNHSERAHAKLSASGSSQWLNCPGSVAAQADYPDSSSIYAQEGTLAHELADICLSKNQDADEYVGKQISVWNEDEVEQAIDTTITQEMANYVQEYLDYVRSFNGKGTELMCETKVNFSHVVPDGFGTCDATVVDYENGTIHVIDLKYGRGVAVSSYKNTQLSLYALGVLAELDEFGTEEFEKVVLHIVQPRLPGYAPSTYEMTLDELNEFAQYASKGAEIALSQDAKRIPGDKQCQFCKHKSNCVELKEHVEQVITAEFDDLDDLVDVESKVKKIDDATKKNILDNQSLVESFLKAVRENVQKTLEDGGKFDGYKLVRGRSNRKLTDDGEQKLVRKIGKKVAYNLSLIPLGQAEKEVQKKVGDKKVAKEFIDSITFKPLGAITLAPDYDKRESITVVENVVDEFDDIDDGLDDL